MNNLCKNNPSPWSMDLVLSMGQGLTIESSESILAWMSSNILCTGLGKCGMTILQTNWLSCVRTMSSVSVCKWLSSHVLTRLDKVRHVGDGVIQSGCTHTPHKLRYKRSRDGFILTHSVALLWTSEVRWIHTCNDRQNTYSVLANC